jgi:hypothetical protein
MEMKPVTSSQIEAISHDPATNQMHIRFKGGSTYSYDNVTAKQHQDLMSATSIGKHFGQHFKSNSAHPYKKVAK